MRSDVGTVAVVVGGGRVVAPPGPPPDLVVAADSGLDAALAAGLSPHVLVGDLDSVSAEGLAWAHERGVPVERHPADKDETDTALALRVALASGHRALLVLGSAGMDRLDHLLGTLGALGDPALAAFDDVRALLAPPLGCDPPTSVRVVHPGRSTVVEGVPGGRGRGRTFSLLALHGRCTGVDVAPARWPLAGAVLEPGSTLGVSNETSGSAPARVEVGSGVLTVVVPPEVAS